jgi:hypothetical protein
VEGMVISTIDLLQDDYSSARGARGLIYKLSQKISFHYNKTCSNLSIDIQTEKRYEKNLFG